MDKGEEGTGAWVDSVQPGVRLTVIWVLIEMIRMAVLLFSYGWDCRFGCLSSNNFVGGWWAFAKVQGGYQAGVLLIEGDWVGVETMGVERVTLIRSR